MGPQAVKTEEAAEDKDEEDHTREWGKGVGKHGY